MDIKLKRSADLDGSDAKQPQANQLQHGELAVNYNADDPALFLKDSSNTVKKLSFENGTPEAPNDGELYGRQSEGWVAVPDPGIADAPNDGDLYGRQSEGWVAVPDPGISDAPSDGKQYAREDGAWAEVVSGGGDVEEAPNDGQQYARQNEG